MQKISSYLYPNRINLTVDLATHPTEWRIVYQRKFKIYKGFKNDLLLDIKNAEQKRINVSDKNIMFLILDQNNQEIYSSLVTHSSTAGLATVSIPASTFDYVKPQFLKYSVYILNIDTSKTPVYGDTQFGLTGTIELIDSGLEQPIQELVIDTFNYMTDESVYPFVKKYTSESVLVNSPNDIVANPTIELDFIFNNFEGSISTQFTEDSVVQTESIWKTVETFNVASTTTTLTKTYTNPSYSKNVNWLRIQYVLNPNTTGKIDKIIVRR